MFIKYDPFCGTPNIFYPQDCCKQELEDYLVAQPGDIWQLPIPYDNNVELRSCCDDSVVFINVASVAIPYFSTFVFEIVNIQPDGIIRFAKVCDGVVTCSAPIQRSSYGSETAFLDAALLIAIGFFNADFIYSSRVGYTFDLRWYQLTPPDTNCLCGAIVSVNGNFSNVPNDCGLPDINAIDCQLEPILTDPITDCNLTEKYLNLVQLQYYNACIKIISKPECVYDPLVTIRIPANTQAGCYYLYQDGQGCSQKIYVGTGCFSHLVRSRNYGENYRIMRIECMVTNPEFKKEQDVSRISNRLRKIFSRVEKQWQFDVNFYNQDIHTDIITMLESDTFEIFGLWDGLPLPFYKEFVVEDTYKPKWSTDYPRNNYGTGNATIVEISPIINNSFCN